MIAFKSLKKFFICGGGVPSMGTKRDIEDSNSETEVGREHIPIRKQCAFDSDYEVLGPLGFPGSFGVVSSCKDRLSGVLYAVKVINYSKDNGEIVNSEIDLMRTLEHQNIVKGRAIYKSKHCASIVMDRYEGGDLFDAVMEKRFVGEGQNARVVTQILAGIKYLHDMRLSHCDLKLASIMLTNASSNPCVKIIDFGESQYICEGSFLSSEVGSPSYMAPEVLGRCYNESNDMWSLGVIVFVMLFGYNPFNPKGICGHKYFDVIARNINKGFCPKVKAAYGACFPKTIPVSEEAMDFISKLLVFDHNQRMSVDEALAHPWIVSAMAD